MTSLRDEERAQLCANDEAAWSVHIDALLEAGDPRGALAVQQRAAPIAHARLPPAQRALIDEHHLTTTSHLADLAWHRGYWHGFGNWMSSRPKQEWSAIFGHPSAAFLRSLSMRWIPPRTFLSLLQTHRPPLSQFHWNDDGKPIDFDPFFEALPFLEDLSLWRPVTFSAGSKRPLRKLSMNAPGRALPETIADYARRGGLTHVVELELWSSTGAMPWLADILANCRPTTLTLSGNVKGDAVGPLIATKTVETVEHLTLTGFWPGKDIESLVAALERRTTPLESYKSTGLEPDDAHQARLRRVAKKCEISG